MTELLVFEVLLHGIDHSFIQPFCFFHIHFHSLFKSQVVQGHVNDFSGLHISDGITWYPIPSRPWPVSSTPTMYLLGSVFLCSEVLERDNGVSSKFVVYSQGCEFLHFSACLVDPCIVATCQSLFPELQIN